MKKMEKLPVKYGIYNKKALWEEIRTFSKNKIVIAITLVLVGLLGIIIPVIPGIFLFLLAIALFKKGWMTKFRKKFRLWKLK